MNRPARAPYTSLFAAAALALGAAACGADEDGPSSATADAGASGGDGGAKGAASDAGVDRSSHVIMEGTAFETEVYVRDSPEPGPTAFVLAGQHGNERAGWEAAERLLDGDPEAGKLVVIPRADQTAIEAEAREGDAGDLNRHWPTGEEPTSEIARAIWAEVERHDPDVVLDLQSSSGIYGQAGDGVGQAVFPTPSGRELATAATERFNEAYIEATDFAETYHFALGSDQEGERPLFSHKIGGDTDAAGFMVQTTRLEISHETEVTWGVAVSLELLEEAGLDMDLGDDALAPPERETAEPDLFWELDREAHNLDVRGHVAIDDPPEPFPFDPEGRALRATFDPDEHPFYGSDMRFDLGERFGARPERAHARFWMLFPEGFEWHDASHGGSKHAGFATHAHGCGAGGSACTGDGFSARMCSTRPGSQHDETGGDAVPLLFQTYDATAAEADLEYGWHDSFSTGGPNLGEWFRVDHYVEMNTPGEDDGVLMVWINGEPVFDKRTHRFRDEDHADLGVQYWRFIDYFGGGWGTPVRQSLYYRNIELWMEESPLVAEPIN